MKTIEVSDEDYETLMALSKELQLQDNTGQTFPYFWEPSSKKLVTNVNDEGSIVRIYDGNTSESYTLSDYAEYEEALWEQFLDHKDSSVRNYSEEDEDDWLEFIKDNKDDVRVYTMDYERICDHNPSLFMSDVDAYCKNNTHHLGLDPHAFSHSMWRMPKMQALVEAIYRINKQPKETVNDEARRFVYKDEKEKGGQYTTTIQEAKELKLATEKSIAELIMHFEEVAGLSVGNVIINEVPKVSDDRTVLISTEVYLEVGL